MVRNLALSLLLFLAVATAGCGGSKSSPTAPVDTNTAMYGTWTGNLTTTTPVVHTLKLVIAQGSVAFYIDGSQFASTVVTMTDPNLTFDVTAAPSDVRREVGVRSASSISGSEFSGGTADATWAVTKN